MFKSSLSLDQLLLSVALPMPCHVSLMKFLTTLLCRFRRVNLTNSGSIFHHFSEILETLQQNWLPVKVWGLKAYALDFCLLHQKRFQRWSRSFQASIFGGEFQIVFGTNIHEFELWTFPLNILFWIELLNGTFFSTVELLLCFQPVHWLSR